MKNKILEKVISEHAAIVPVRDALIEAVKTCPKGHYQTLLKGQLLILNDAVAKLAAVLGGKFPPS
jgi:hypothetical protein